VRATHEISIGWNLCLSSFCFSTEIWGMKIICICIYYIILSIYFIFGSPGYFSPYVRRYMCTPLIDRRWHVTYSLRRYTIFEYIYIYIYRRIRAWHCCSTAVGSKNKGWWDICTPRDCVVTAVVGRDDATAMFTMWITCKGLDDNY